MKKRYYFTVCLALLGLQAFAQTKRYVKENGAGDGSSWNNASGNLQAMINASAPDDEVWVAAGTYKPTEKIDASGGLRDVSFILKAGVKIYGGLADGATVLTNRDFAANASILSGDLGASGKAYHVVVTKGTANNAILDGFTIQDGLADATTSLAGIVRNQGGGINVTNQLANMVFKNLLIKNNQSSGTGNTGGGVYISLQATSDCVFDNVVFDTNESISASGGGISFLALGNAKLTLKNSKVYSCRATGGAGVYSVGSATNIAQLEVLNSVFSQNHGTNTSSTAGAVYVAAYADATIVNCTFYANISAFGAVSFYNNGSTASINIYNSIFNANKKSSSNTDAADVKAKNLANLSLRYNLLQQEYTGYSNVSTNNLIVNANPTNLFLSTTITDVNFLKLIEGTATEKGSNNYAATYGLTTDLAGDLRLKHANVDLGAYEFQGTLPVALESFIAKKVNQSSQLTWKVAAEVDNDRFVIERSTDGVKFNMMSSIASKGNTQQSVTYNYTDFSPKKGNNYYRLYQFDKDGTFKLLGTAVVGFGLTDIEVYAYPNPVSDMLKLQLGAYTGSVSVKMVSPMGQILSSKYFANATGEEKFLDVRNMNAGNYVLLVEANNKTYPIKVIITR